MRVSDTGGVNTGHRVPGRSQRPGFRARRPSPTKAPDSVTTAVILAGGFGTRLRSVVSDRPKVMAEVRGRPYLEYLFDQVLAAGARHAVLCTGYKADQIEAAFGLAYRGLRLSYSEEPSPLGTGGAMRYALPHIESETVLAMNGDSYCAADLTTFQKWHHEHGAAASLLLAQVSDTSRFGRVQTDDEGRVLKFGEKGEHSGPGWINAGIYLIQRELLEAIPEGKISIEREVFPSQIGHGLYASQTGGRFLDIGTPESYAEAEEFFKDPNVKTGYGNHLMPKDFRSPPDYLVEDAGSISQTLSSEEG